MVTPFSDIQAILASHLPSAAVAAAELGIDIRRIIDTEAVDVPADSWGSWDVEAPGQADIEPSGDGSGFGAGSSFSDGGGGSGESAWGTDGDERVPVAAAAMSAGPGSGSGVQPGTDTGRGGGGRGQAGAVRGAEGVVVESAKRGLAGEDPLAGGSASASGSGAVPTADAASRPQPPPEAVAAAKVNALWDALPPVAAPLDIPELLADKIRRARAEAGAAGAQRRSGGSQRSAAAAPRTVAEPAAVPEVIFENQGKSQVEVVDAEVLVPAGGLVSEQREVEGVSRVAGGTGEEGVSGSGGARGGRGVQVLEGGREAQYGSLGSGRGMQRLLDRAQRDPADTQLWREEHGLPAVQPRSPFRYSPLPPPPYLSQRAV